MMMMMMMMTTTSVTTMQADRINMLCWKQRYVTRGIIKLV
jgi:hypothetical protein